jgi:hypothetical protein
MGDKATKTKVDNQSKGDMMRIFVGTFCQLDIFFWVCLKIGVLKHPNLSG